MTDEGQSITYRISGIGCAGVYPGQFISGSALFLSSDNPNTLTEYICRHFRRAVILIHIKNIVSNFKAMYR